MTQKPDPDGLMQQFYPLLGGEANVLRQSRQGSRLTFTVKDQSLAAVELLAALPGVAGCSQQSGPGVHKRVCAASCRCWVCAYSQLQSHVCVHAASCVSRVCTRVCACSQMHVLSVHTRAHAARCRPTCVRMHRAACPRVCMH